MKKFVIEAIGTFALFFLIAQVIANPELGGTGPVIIGIGLMALVYMGGHISKAHYNPSITFAFALSKGMDRKDIPGYLIAEVGGAALAAAIFLWLNPDGLSPLEMEEGPALFAEFFGTFMLALVILNVASAKTLEGNQIYGVSIGAIVLAMAVSVGGHSGGAFNPAVTIGMAMVDVISWDDIWIHFLGQFAGAGFAVILFHFLTTEPTD
ncbi:MAG: aquaporin [Verrucomicrobiota bacterium]